MFGCELTLSRVLELICNMAEKTNNVFSLPSLHLGPSCQLVDEGRQLLLSLHLGPLRQPVDETRGCARTQAQYRPGPKPNDAADDIDRDDY